jgi:hypothetical protein
MLFQVRLPRTRLFRARNREQLQDGEIETGRVSHLVRRAHVTRAELATDPPAQRYGLSGM